MTNSSGSKERRGLGPPKPLTGEKGCGEAGEGAGSPSGGRTGGVYPALVALVTVASKAEETNLKKIVPKESKEEITPKAGALLPAGSKPMGSASPAPGFLWAHMGVT